MTKKIRRKSKMTYIFECTKCGYTIVYETDMKVKKPKKCNNKGCKNKVFKEVD